jgi:hypothetical protein
MLCCVLGMEGVGGGGVNKFTNYCGVTSSLKCLNLFLLQEEECVELAKRTVAECHPEHLLAESKFLLTESLQGILHTICIFPGANIGSHIYRVYHKPINFILPTKYTSAAYLCQSEKK